MNYKRDAVEKFIEKKLPKMVAKELCIAYQLKEDADGDLKKVIQRVKKELEPNAIGPDMELDAKYHNTGAGRAYLQAKKLVTTMENRTAATEVYVYNQLYEFFNRYYQEGDFISKRRYSKNNRYVIPYNGNDVHLHWANNDQYYVKTSEHFHNYEWKSNGVVVQFKIKKANEEHNNNKGDKRFFIPLVENMQINVKSKKITIPFEYRPLTSQESKKYSGTKKQDVIVSKAIIEVQSRCKDLQKDITHALFRYKDNDTNGNNSISKLEYHLKRYVRSNTHDFFIHKDLRGFLSRELDFYLKNEVLNLNNMEHAGEKNADDWFQRMRMIKSIGNVVIDFVSQIESFQKMLWEKRKFVTETHYCVTLQYVNSEFYSEIINNESQWQEWKELLGIDGLNRNKSFLKANPTLVLDTSHFCNNQDFVDRLLSSFNELDEITDGLLIYSENWQALNLIGEKYKHCVKTVYIDPPYNSPSSEIIYKNGYKHSTFLSMINDRVSLSKSLFKDDAVHVTAIDGHEYERTSLLLQSILSHMKHTTISIMTNPSGQQSNNFSSVHDYACFAYRSDNSRQISKQTRTVADERNFRDVTGEDSKRESAKTCFYPIIIKGGKIIGFGDVCKPDYHPPVNVDLDDNKIGIYPVDQAGIERKWRYSRDTVDSIRDEIYPHFLSDRGVWDIQRSKTIFNFKTVWSDPKYSGNNHGTQLLNNIFGSKVFDYPKSIHTVMDCLIAAQNNQANPLILDYFAGSGTTGHAVIQLNRQDDSQRKFILVEMGKYFHTVMLPRIKKVIYTPEWKEGKPARVSTPVEIERSPRIIKYIKLESYEDVLNNIEFGKELTQSSLDSFDDYLLKYMLRQETKGSNTMLNVGSFSTPFTYKLNLDTDVKTSNKTIDISETFNYLIGLYVHSRQTYKNNKNKRYLVYRGETRDAIGHNVVVIWRETKGWRKIDFKHDKEFVKKHKMIDGVDKIYVNGDSLIPGAQPVEKAFCYRMFAGTNAAS